MSSRRFDIWGKGGQGVVRFGEGREGLAGRCEAAMSCIVGVVEIMRNVCK